ncbi:MAG: LysR family transcriptional regulator [Verrucomicrobiaceae bacterium]|nr:LysR family transcriptional regulator [Verrucomicrobiaceae bacterium]
METLNSIECFVRSAEAGSFSEAARRLSLTAAAVGKNIAKLEKNLGVRLFHRSTRQLTLTEAGERFLNEVSGGLSTIQTAVANLASADGQPAGTLKVSMGASFGRLYLVPLLGEFLGRYPAIVPDWHFDNRQVDLIGEGFDAAIGGGIDLPPGVIARQLTPAYRVLVAARAYLDRKPTLKTPADLSKHDGILIRSPQSGRISALPLRNRGHKQVALELPMKMAMSDPDAACLAAAAGLGVALVAMPQALPYLNSGAVLRVLPDWYVDAGTISIYFAAHKLLPAKTRAFVDFVVAQFREQKWAEQFSPL